MRIRWLLFALGMCTASPGCSLFVAAARDLTYEAKLGLQDISEAQRNARLARAAWEKLGGDKSSSPDYAHGFKTGFADYLQAGGTGQPPPLPPRCYWGLRYQTPEGHKAIDQWFAGFKDGAASAQASGWRNLVVVPTKSALLPPQPAPLGSPPLPPGAPTAAPAPPPRANEELPAPRVQPKTPTPAPSPAPLAEPAELPPLPPVPGNALAPVPSYSGGVSSSAPLATPARPFILSPGEVVPPAPVPPAELAPATSAPATSAPATSAPAPPVIVTPPEAETWRNGDPPVPPAPSAAPAPVPVTPPVAAPAPETPRPVPPLEWVPAANPEIPEP